MSNTFDPLTFAKSVALWALAWLTCPRSALLFGEPFFWLLGMRRQGGGINLSKIKHILLVRLDEIGDVVMTSPLLRELRKKFPEATITLVVKPQIHNIVELCPYVNAVLTYDWKVRGRFRNLRRHWRALSLAWRSLWRRRFDLAILPRWDADYYNGTFLLYFSGAPWRVGYSEDVIRHKKHLNGSFDRLLTHTLGDSSLKHEVEHNLDLVRLLGGEIQDDSLELWIDEEDEAFAEKVVSNHRGKTDDLLISLAPGAGAPNRLWPVDRFAELGLWIQNKYGARLLVVGGPGEEQLGEELERNIGASVVNTIGRTTLRQTAALLGRSRLFIGNDAGPMHIAAAVGVPIVELSCHPESGSPWSPNSPVRFKPWRENHIVIQPRISRDTCTAECIAKRSHCILGITVERIKEVVAKQLC